MPQNPEDMPITGMCIVSDPNQCPHGYQVLLTSYDKQEDCDLWKDSFFRSKVTRYLCFTRIYPLDGGRLNNVLGDIVINNERDPPPTGFSTVDFTVDSREKATRKRQVNVRMLPRESTQDAICDIILLSRSKRPPIGYTLVGEVNGLLVCFKMGPVPQDSRSPAGNHTPIGGHVPGSSFDFAEWAQSLRQSYPISPLSQCGPSWSLPSPSSPFLGAAHSISSNPPAATTNYSLSPQPGRSPPPQPSPKHFTRQDSLLQPGAALEGVPFVLNARYQDTQGLSLNNVPEIQYRSLVDIENEYSYNFRLERTSAAQIQ